MSVLFTTGPHSNNTQGSLFQLEGWESLRFESQGAVALAGLCNSSRVVSRNSVFVLAHIRAQILTVRANTRGRVCVMKLNSIVKIYSNLKPLYGQLICSLSSDGDASSSCSSVPEAIMQTA